MIRSATSIISKFGPIVLIGSLAWLGWDNLGPQKPQAGTIQRELASEMMPEMLRDLRENRGELRSAALLHFKNDPTDYLTSSLRSAVEQSGIFDMHDTSLTYKARSLLRLRHRGYSSLEEALRRGRSLGVDAVIFGRVYAFEASPDGAAVDMEVVLAGIEPGASVLSERYARSISGAAMPPLPGERLGSGLWITRLFIWVVVVLLLPIVTIGFIRTMMRKESNGVNAFILGTYTVVDALLAFLFVGTATLSWFVTPVLIMAIGAAFVYNYKIMEFALKLET